MAMPSVAGKIGRILLGLVVLLVAAAIALYAVGSGRVDRTYALDYDPAPIPADSEAVALGKYVVETHGCTGCHAADLSGAMLVDAPPFTIVAPNLTPGGIGRSYSDGDWLRAVRHGVRPDGRGLFIMPSTAYWHLDDMETGAVIAYLKTVPAVDNELPESRIKVMGRIIAALDESFAPDLAFARPDRVRLRKPADSTASMALGEYRASVLCAHCHGADLRGAMPPDPESPFAPDLASVKAWASDGFIRAMRTGETPGGRALDNVFMPWEHFGHMTDVELESLYAFLQTL